MTDVIIVGAGVGGLSCAAFLAKAGLDVIVLEASDRVGGCCKTTDQDGFLFEDGSLWISMDYLCHQYFSELGFDFEGMVPTIRLDPTTRCILPDGKIFHFIPDRERMAAEVARLSPNDVTGLSYPRDGMQRVPQALQTIFIGFGGTVRTRASVDRILIDDGRAVGVQTAHGETLHVRMVITDAEDWSPLWK